MDGGITYTQTTYTPPLGSFLSSVFLDLRRVVPSDSPVVESQLRQRHLCRKDRRGLLLLTRKWPWFSGGTNALCLCCQQCTMTQLCRWNADPGMLLMGVRWWRNQKLLLTTTSSWVGWIVEISCSPTMASHIAH